MGKLKKIGIIMLIIVIALLVIVLSINAYRDHMCVKLMHNNWEYDNDNRHSGRDLQAFANFCL